MLDVLRFAQHGRLLQAIGPTAAKLMAAEAEARRLSPGMWLLKNYLFIRVRLIDPDRLLGHAAEMLGSVFTPAFPIVMLCLAVLGFYLIGRQWDTYTHAFLPLLSLEGAAEVSTAMVFVKAIHEFGHGLVAKRLGCRVPGMGVAMLVLWPLAELVVAVLASLAWSVLPDGPARQAAFLLSGSTCLITVAVNINPLMRFDGYFLMSDWLEEPNLQERSFALARWRLRELLFGFRDPPPEVVPPARRHLLIGYALACWTYRFGLFLGIALLVYRLAFKLLGIFLMMVEVGWFLARPIVAELAIWPRRLHAGGMTRRAGVTVALLALFIAGMVLP